jgi:hypothetical protein
MGIKNWKSPKWKDNRSIARGSVVAPVDPALMEIANASEAKPSAMKKTSRNDIIYLLLTVRDKKIRSTAD